MPIEITMPKLSDTMEEGTILRWLKQVGDPVQAGDVVAEVETDKADMELEADKSGTLAEIRVKEGDAAAVGTVLAILDAVGATTPAAAPKPERPAAPTKVERPVAPKTPPAAAPPAAARAAAAAPKPSPPAAAPRVAAAAPAAPKAPQPAAATSARAGDGRQELSRLQQTVAKQMVASKREIPHFYVTAEIDMSEVARLRTSLATSGTVPEHLTFTHFIIKALAVTLPRHPRLNASWSDGTVVVHPDVNIGVAVAVEDGLLAPVLRQCQNLSLRAIARTAGQLVEKAQAGRFSGEDLTGATFTVSNLGMLDIEEFTAVITPPQAAILAVGAIKERAVVRDGHVAIAKTMRVTVSADHRVLNGMEAGRFLEDLKHTLESPVVLVMGAD